MSVRSRGAVEPSSSVGAWRAAAVVGAWAYLSGAARSALQSANPKENRNRAAEKKIEKCHRPQLTRSAAGERTARAEPRVYPQRKELLSAETVVHALTGAGPGAQASQRRSAISPSLLLSRDRRAIRQN